MPDPRPRSAARTPVPDVDLERLRAIKSFPQLVKYLRDDLDWPIDSDSVEDLTYEYTPDELGLDAKSAVKVKEIKQLRPLDSKQPWGIFFVNFEPKKLPVVVLRRILRSLVVNKRGAAKQSDRAAWARHDLLFISAYGEGDDRAITFAHFADPPAGHENDLPTLKVLGWDDQDTVLHLDMVHRDLSQHLRWPTDSAAAAEPAAWRARWSKAFTIAHGEVVRTSKDLAVRLAELAARIRKRARTVLAHESEKGELRTLHKAFQESLIHDLSQDDFADMYAQTIAYGLLTAAVSRHSPDAPGVPVSADSAVDMVPITNPFLKEMLERFLKAGGRNGHAAKSPHKGIDFDELGVSEVVDLLRTANMDAVLRDFGNRNPLEDPVIHFYELFLKEYDPKKRMQRGVFYTPRPVVSFIVRSVHEILQKEFGLADGLADTATWADMLKRNPDLKLPEIEVKDEKAGKTSKRPIDAAADFVQILDPATGTGTFLVEVIDVIHKALVDRWTREKKTKAEITRLWNEYVPAHLLPRLHGYELMPAPYAIAHMKIGLKLHETGYGFGSEERVRVYLTNALEPAQDFSDRLEFEVPALAHEARAVNSVKQRQSFTVLIGNPPYSGHSVNMGAFARSMIEPFKAGCPELAKPAQAKWLSDDYVKFYGLAQSRLAQTGTGVLGFITNHSYLDNPTFRGMRRTLLDTFGTGTIVDLHGNSKKKETAPDGSADENVFDIQQGVAIAMWVSRCDRAPMGRCDNCAHRDLFGGREAKYLTLIRETAASIGSGAVHPLDPQYALTIQDATLRTEYEVFVSVRDIFSVNGDPAPGIVTTQDEFAVSWTRAEAAGKVERLLATKTETEARGLFRLCSTEQWSYARAKKELADGTWRREIVPILYRPFDIRFTVYNRNVAVHRRERATRHMLGADRLALITARSNKSPSPDHFLVTSLPAETKCGESTTQSHIFPLWLREEADDAETTARVFAATDHPNLSPVVQQVFGRLCKGDVAVAARSALHWFYAVAYAPSYRSRYAAFLKTDYPRFPLPPNPPLFRALAALGGELVALHLLESPRLHQSIATYVGSTRPEVEKLSWFGDTVWLDKAHTRGFRGVPETVWNFHIGGYQVCEKWLKDRKGRTLSKDDIEHYQKIIVALSETIRIMGEIDKVIEEHGGWPGAFVTGEK